MATFHRMTGRVGQATSSAASSRARPTSCSPAARARSIRTSPALVDDDFRERYMDENQRLAEQGLRVLATARKDFEPDASTRTPTCWS